MFLYIALIENAQLVNIVDYHEFESWSDYYGFVERNMSLVREGQQVILMLFQDGRVIHCDNYENGVLTEVL